MEQDYLFKEVVTMGVVRAEIIPNKMGHFMMLCKPSDFDMIYNKMMRLTDGDHEVASDAASWCELATVGEIYEFREGVIEIKEAS